ncbi:SIMPL domain-containing protein [Phenylobacterium sp.]|uniref:SIMPL domain-containing protein n=1 Tax=Phenylobacterium sp. TaxID=1871053 RepID=UPI001211C157|nr:SIMPL domain-containing protein [Phenylobacterium sp.]THD61240.1 MAG: DUF541 domain-containing protein [Phenylobacterium sp.]
MTTLFRAGALALALAATGAPAALAQAESPAAADRFHATTLTLSAYGETVVEPDMASLHLGVTTEAKTAAEAMAANAAQMSRILAALKAAGIAAKDIQTSGLNLNPQYVYVQNESPHMTGYQAAQQVTVLVHDLAKLGPVVDATVSAGANQVNGISFFGLADPTAAEDAAREQAVRALKAKADLYARAAGYRVLRLVTLSEGGAVESPPEAMVPLMAKTRVQGVPVATGSLNVRAEVSGLYELSR